MEINRYCMQRSITISKWWNCFWMLEQMFTLSPMYVYYVVVFPACTHLSLYMHCECILSIHCHKHLFTFIEWRNTNQPYHIRRSKTVTPFGQRYLHFCLNRTFGSTANNHSRYHWDQHLKTYLNLSTDYWLWIKFIWHGGHGYVLYMNVNIVSLLFLSSVHNVIYYGTYARLYYYYYYYTRHYYYYYPQGLPCCDCKKQTTRKEVGTNISNKQ